MDRVVRDYKLFSRVNLGLLGTSAQDRPCSVPIPLLHPLYSYFPLEKGKAYDEADETNRRRDKLIIGWTLELAYV